MPVPKPTGLKKIPQAAEASNDKTILPSIFVMKWQLVSPQEVAPRGCLELVVVGS